tara:strand:- start:179 stop:451 length:273 start_codon:yes stop_codon:yes gene_type:complete
MILKLLNFLFWFFVLSYIIKFLSRIFLPIFVKRFIRKSSQRFGQQFNNMNRQGTKSNEGEVTIESKKTKSKLSDKVGEYVDFEEIDEKNK